MRQRIDRLVDDQRLGDEDLQHLLQRLQGIFGIHRSPLVPAENCRTVDKHDALTLRRTGGAGELGILQFDHPTVPAMHQQPPGGVLLNFEVDDVDDEYRRLVQGAGLPLVREITTEEFGQRHFITRDPAGVLIDVITVVPPSAEYASNYA